MKRFLILLMLYIILLISSIAYSQDFNIPAEGAEWNIADVQGTTYYAKRIISRGDTIQIDGLDSTYSAYIQDIDTITIDEHPRKRFTLRGAHDFHDEWIDGIGSLYGLFATFTRPWEKFVSELTCYRESGNRIYPSNTNCDRCDLVTTSLEKQFDSPISIYPNPLHDKAIISWPKAMYARKLLIYDLTGRIIVENDLRGFEHFVIKRQEMNTGVLLVEIIDDSGISHLRRIVVQ